ncbi:hypothetical protein LCGC14_0718650 [marine sediment metagenome]|uniref:Uncharacterized protein n=1 Tax=marine sediment metagenome TaxID=412755 RepID=A0A0F9QD40_9ZZZZ
MGIYIKFNHYFFRRENANQFNETKKLINSLIKSEIFEPIHSLVCNFYTGIEKGSKKFPNLNNFQEIFSEIEERYSIPKFYKFQLKSSMNLFKNDDYEIDEIPITIKIWRKILGKGSLKGNIAIEFVHKEDLFNTYFIGNKIWAKKNKKKLIHTIEKLNIARLGRYHTDSIAKINIGQKAFPFENVKECFYIWRNTPEAAYKDIMHFRQQIIKQYRKINLSNLSKEQQKDIIKVREEMIEPYDQYYIPIRDLDRLTMNIVLRLTRLIDDYIKPKVIIERGSYSLMTPVGSSELLHSVLYDINLKINKVFEKKIPTKITMNRDVRKGFYEVFRTFSEYEEEDKEKRIKLVEVLSKYIKKKVEEILKLKDNWDGEGSKAYNQETLTRSKNFLISLVESFWIIYQLELDIPMIFPGINGDIDLEWKNNKFQLLISIPEDKNELAGLYGNNYGEDEIKLDFDINILNPMLISWLKRQM